jgi:hypothetical protein
MQRVDHPLQVFVEAHRSNANRMRTYDERRATRLRWLEAFAATAGAVTVSAIGLPTNPSQAGNPDVELRGGKRIVVADQTTCQA